VSGNNNEEDPGNRITRRPAYERLCKAGELASAIVDGGEATGSVDSSREPSRRISSGRETIFMPAKPIHGKKLNQAANDLTAGRGASIPRILLAAGQPLVAGALAKLLEPEFQVVCHAADGRALLESAAKLKPNVVILDLTILQLNGVDSGRRLKEILPNAKIVVLSAAEDSDVATRVVRSWASAFLLKNSPPGELVDAVREVLKGKSYATPRRQDQNLDGRSVSHESSAPTKSLTARQREVLQLLVEGRTMREAATILGVTPRTVAFHKYKIMHEFGLTNNSDLVRLAIKTHLIPAP
jgi:DNA-binding NarL/FixJ family response regulator